MKADVAAIIVTYNSAQPVRNCLKSVEDRVNEVVVVDNASTDETCRVVEESVPRAVLLRNSSNRGFATAVNQGVAASSTPFVLLLNPDSILMTPVDAMVAACRAKDVGAAGGKLIDMSNKPQQGFNVRSLPTPWAVAFEVLGVNRFWPSNPVNRRYRRLDLCADQTQDVEQPAGAFLMLRRDVLERTGGLDERFYPLWFEDVDLCWRIRELGYRIRYVPGSVARHEGAHSLHAMTLEQRYVAWYGSLLRFHNKHFSIWTRRWLRPLICVALLGRWVLALGAGQREQRKAFTKALKLISGRHLSHYRVSDTSVGTRLVDH